MLPGIFEFEALGEMAEDAGAAPADPVLDLAAAAPADGAAEGPPTPTVPPPPSFGQREAQMLEQTFGNVAALTNMIAEAREAAADPPQGLPEWDPYDPNVVKAYNDAHFREALQPLLPLLHQAREGAQAHAVQVGEQRAGEVFGQIIASPEMASVPAHVRDNVDRDLALSLVTPYLEYGVPAEQALAHATSRLAQYGQKVATAAVEAYRQSLVQASSGHDAPMGSSGIPGAPEPRDDGSESVYRLQGRRTLSRLNPAVPA